MKTIDKFFRRLKNKYGDRLRVYYYPDDVYHIMWKGYGIDTFTTEQFYQYQPYVREKIIDKCIVSGVRAIKNDILRKRLNRLKLGKRII